MARTSDNTFLADEIKPRKSKGTITYMDGFRFGFGSTIGFLLVALIVGGITAALIVGLHIH